MKTDKKAKSWLLGDIFFAGLFIFYSFIMFILFYRQCIACEGVGANEIFVADQYASDMHAYILHARGLDSGFNFPYPVMFLVARFLMLFTNPYMAMAIGVTILNSFSMVLVKYYMDRIVKDTLISQDKQWNAGWDILVSVLTLSILFVSMVYAPKGHGFFGFDYIYRCNGSYTPNPYWNATYLATRPFSIVCFFSGVRLLDSYETGAKRKDVIVFALSLLLTTMTKPSYTLVAVTAFAGIMLYRFLKSKGKNFKQSVMLALAFIPTGLMLLYQYAGVFTGTNSQGEETGMGFAIGKAWSLFTNNIPLSVVMAAAFPIGVLFINAKRLKDTTWFRHSWQVWLSGFLMLLCLYEKGFRLTHMNFSWGYMHGLFFLFVASVLMLLRNTIEKKSKFKTLLVCVGWAGYLWHLGCGIVYFLYIYSGQNSGFF